MKLKYKKSGFSLVELSISTTILLVLSALVTSFWVNFNKFSEANKIQSEMETDLKLVEKRMEAFILPAKNVLGATPDNSIVADNNHLILKVPAPGSKDLSDPTTKFDTVVFEYDPNNTTTGSLLSNTKTGNDSKLLFSLIPGTGSPSSAINKRALYNFINSKDENQQPYNLFEYYELGSGTGLANYQTSTNYNKVSLVKIRLFSKKFIRGDMYKYAKKITDFRLRNF